MSSFDELVKQRRSIRKYRVETPPEACIEQMLLTASQAPSPGNSQPVRFVRINSSGLKAALRESMDTGRQRFLQAAATSDKPKKLRNWINAYYRYSEFMFHAPILMAVGTVANLQGFSRKLSEAGLAIPGVRVGTDSDIAVGLALEGFILKGQELGLGSCILTAPLGFISGAEKIIGLKDMEIKCFVVVGFPDENPHPPSKKGIQDIYHKI
jgi:nitroreductase